jgi:hypothetical protein
MHRDRSIPNNKPGKQGPADRSKPPSNKHDLSTTRTSYGTPKAEPSRKVSPEASLELEGAAYERFVANVAASIIQHHWRQHRLQHVCLQGRLAKRNPSVSHLAGSAPSELVNYDQQSSDTLQEPHDDHFSKLQRQPFCKKPMAPEGQPRSIQACTPVEQTGKRDTGNVVLGRAKSTKDIVDRAEAIVSSAGLRSCPGELLMD